MADGEMITGAGLAGRRMQRAQGALAITVKRRGAATVLDRLRQDGCLKARLPRIDTPDRAEIVTLNIGGGIAGGDRLAIRLDAAPATAVTLTAQAAERFYRALPGSAPSCVTGEIRIGAGALVEWLPQEAILFDGCALDRRLDVVLDEGARFVGIETLVFGRAAMGEQVERAAIRDLIRVRREGRLVLNDAVRIDGAVRRSLDRAAVGAGARAVATLVYVAPDAGERMEGLRAAWDGVAAECGVSAWDGMLVGRIAARNGDYLRRAIVAGLAVLREGRALPRVWQC